MRSDFICFSGLPVRVQFPSSGYCSFQSCRFNFRFGLFPACPTCGPRTWPSWSGRLGQVDFRLHSADGEEGKRAVNIRCQSNRNSAHQVVSSLARRWAVYVLRFRTSRPFKAHQLRPPAIKPLWQWLTT